MSLRAFLTTQFKYAKTSYSISSLADIKKILYSDKGKGTVYSGTRSSIYHFAKSGPYTKVYDLLAERIYTFLNDSTVETKATFDNWHDNLCQDFLSECAKQGITGAFDYGLAQKFVNLALKYCYCFHDADEAENNNKFKYCHIALDSYTYCPANKSHPKRTWASYRKYFKMSSVGLQLPFYTEIVNPTVNISTLPAWSQLHREKYIDIQNEMRTYFDLNPVTYSMVDHLDTKHIAGCSGTTELTPFQIEFLLWK